MDIHKIAISALVALAMANLIALCIIAIPTSQQGTPSVDGLKAIPGILSPDAGGTVRYAVDNALTAPENNEMATVTIASARKTVTYLVEVADTPDKIRQGLMYRTSLAPDRGMLFVFDRDGDRHFWMENTLISLDMIYISSDGRVVGVRENAIPESTVSIEPPGPSMYVLEVSGGQCRRQGICAGDPVTIALA